jgi:hypothetical protein
MNIVTPKKVTAGAENSLHAVFSFSTICMAGMSKPCFSLSVLPEPVYSPSPGRFNRVGGTSTRLIRYPFPCRKQGFAAIDCYFHIGMKAAASKLNGNTSD